ncbi:hypothetical protein C5F49_00820 [Nitrosopumilus oxyclinae]|uniref:SGNH/GDSL hydrolase family protein n=1 Tax=Nitrosopumilus oxyclinae TaxID=1959104 RepID=A0A7D5M0K9_9ARCH|nr:hypothetical protein [Nitrosopumilus oxyclinae]QLH04026.1 hypothetical protein C5F49_00820 [Nitrosopumilus oxyclinae]
MNGRIGLVLLMIFIIVFSGLFYFNSMFSNISEDKFYSQEFDLSKKKILIYGSSHMVQLNSTYITEKIENHSNEYLLFNMAENADTPKRRSLNIDKDLKINPELIVYGIGFRDFNLLQNEKKKSEIKLIDIIPLDTTELETLNPKLTTLEALRAVVIDIFTKNEKSTVPYPNTSIFSNRNQEIILDEDKLKSNEETFGKILIPIEKNEQVEYFKSIIKKLKENNIEIIIILTPHHKIALDEIPDNEKNNFYQILLNVEQEFDVKIYDFSNKFSDLPIWRDTTHVAYNEKAIIFSHELAQIIIQEITK